jgi:hypothetical protein
MGEKVYLAGLRCRDPADNTLNKVRRLFDAAGFFPLFRGSFNRDKAALR